MMTIKEFSGLCRCGAQTLRYYDRIGLLKPAKVDPWTGYRYYQAEQAIDFIKIKNLQAADFTIDEIKTLLTQSDRELYTAFDRKIQEQQQKLERIKAIQQSYLREKTGMERIIHSISDFLLSQLSDYEGLWEFGLAPEDGPRITETLRSYFQKSLLSDSVTAENMTLVVNDEIIQGADNVADRIQGFSRANLADTILLGDSSVAEEEDFDPAQFDVVWETHGWEHVHQFIHQIPVPEKGREHCCWFQLTRESRREDISFPLFMLGALLVNMDLTDISMSCSVETSGDGENHFSLLRRK